MYVKVSFANIPSFGSAGTIVCPTVLQLKDESSNVHDARWRTAGTQCSSTPTTQHGSILNQCRKY